MLLCLMDYSCPSPCASYLYPSCHGIPTVNSCHLIVAADLKKKKKKTRSTPKHSCKHVLVQNPTVYPKQTTFYHNNPILSRKHVCVTFIFLFSNPSAGSPHPAGLGLTEREPSKQYKTGTVLKKQTKCHPNNCFHCSDSKNVHHIFTNRQFKVIRAIRKHELK